MVGQGVLILVSLACAYLACWGPTKRQGTYHVDWDVMGDTRLASEARDDSRATMPLIVTMDCIVYLGGVASLAAACCGLPYGHLSAFLDSINLVHFSVSSANGAATTTESRAPRVRRRLSGGNLGPHIGTSDARGQSREDATWWHADRGWKRGSRRP